MNTKRINDNIIEISSKDGFLHKKGTETYAKRVIIVPSDSITNWEEVEEMPKFTQAEYEEEVNKRIREKYTLEQELAIKRKAFNMLIAPNMLSESDTDKIVQEYSDFNVFVESCKTDAKQYLNNGKESQTEE